LANDYEIKLKAIKLQIRTGRPQLSCVCLWPAGQLSWYSITHSGSDQWNHRKELLYFSSYYFHFQAL